MSNPAAITLAHHIRRSDQVLFQDMGGEAVLLDLASEAYFGLNEVGTRIWKLVGDGNSLQAIFDQLCAEYDAPADDVRTDLLDLAQRLQSAGLLTIG